MRIGVEVRRLAEIHTAAPSVGAEEGVHDVDRSHPLRVGAVPGDVASRDDQGPGPRRGHDSGGLPDLVGGEIGDRRRPFRRQVRYVSGELIEALRPLGDEGRVVEPLGDEHVDPRQEERRVGARLDRQPVVGLAGRGREARVHHDDAGTPSPGSGEILHDGVAGVLSDVAPDEGDALDVLPIHRLVAADGPAQREQGGLLPRRRAQRRRRAGCETPTPAAGTR